ncbi:unnamed protein product [Strongylus vulgaris]|uniref:Uncharacterized protein n=1 Tax=Strongylus vulgaris TaxID=40348 RepID=A0A3P7JQ56_STRVU|nr:unnamed protein product [Strongylus vulgaris]
MDMGVTQRYASCGRPHLAAGDACWTSQCRKLEKKICHRVGGRRKVVCDHVRMEDFLTTCGQRYEGSATGEENTEAGADCITSRATGSQYQLQKVLQEDLRKYRQSILLEAAQGRRREESTEAGADCITSRATGSQYQLQKALQEDLRKYRQSILLEAAQGRRSLKMRRRDLPATMFR